MTIKVALTYQGMLVTRYKEIPEGALWVFDGEKFIADRPVSFKMKRKMLTDGISVSIPNHGSRIVAFDDGGTVTARHGYQVDVTAKVKMEEWM